MIDTEATLDGLQLFFGDSSAAEARLYALLPAAAAPPGCTLSGVVTGPRCAYAHTLEAAAALVARGAKAGGDNTPLVAEALIADPCFWSPDLPMLYHARVELRRAGELLATVECSLGIRPLGTRDRTLLFGGHPYVLRGVHRDVSSAGPVQDWRDAAAAMVAVEPDDELCREASRLGVLLVARLSPSVPEMATAVRRIGRWPAVVVVVLEGAGPIDAALRSEARNVLFAQRVSEGVGSLFPVTTVADGPRSTGKDSRPPYTTGTRLPTPSACDLVICEDVDAATLADRAADCSKPVVALRRAARCMSVAAARRECDLLQRDLAGRGDFVGYIV